MMLDLRDHRETKLSQPKDRLISKMSDGGTCELGHTGTKITSGVDVTVNEEACCGKVRLIHRWIYSIKKLER
jgi:hypothetical protein